jgi:Acyl-CoA reductase (LuxC)
VSTGGNHFWQGEWIDDAEVGRRLPGLAAMAERALSEPLDPELVIAACDRLSQQLADPATAPPPWAQLTGLPPERADDERAELAGYLSGGWLRGTRDRELAAGQPSSGGGWAGTAGGNGHAGDRAAAAQEEWAPLGLLVHIVPGNVAAAGPVSLVEGLLTGNVNAAKTSSDGGLLSQRVAAALAGTEPRLASYLIVLRFPSRRADWLSQLCAPADAVTVWGGDAAVAGIAGFVPSGVPLIAWGPKISFAYLGAGAWRDTDTLAAMARDVCRYDQAACSSPQVLYLDTDDHTELFAAAGLAAAALSAVDDRRRAAEPGRAERAEITNVVTVARQEQHLGLTRVWSGPDHRWHVIADTRPELRASPLFRTLWVKPLPRDRIVATLHPARRYLQTVGLAPGSGHRAAMIRSLLAAGAVRITDVGAMHSTYPGEPHDGQHALRRYSRRVSINSGAAG